MALQVRRTRTCGERELQCGTCAAGTSASRAGFLIQTISIMVPLIAAAGGERVARATWLGCAMGVTGAIMIISDRGASLVGARASLSPAPCPCRRSACRSAPPLQASLGSAAQAGDAMVLLACIFYALGTVRLSKYARLLDPVSLAAKRQLALALYAAAWLLVVAAGALLGGRPLVSLWPGFSDLANWGLVLYVALANGALTALLQTMGQSRVGAAQAQVIYSSTPLWSAIFANMLIGTERMSQWGWAGGALIMVAGLVAAVDEMRRGKDKPAAH